MLLFSVLGTAALLFVLHRLGRLHGLGVIAILAVTSAGVWMMILRTAALPRAMTVLPQKDEGFHRPLAISADSLFWMNERGLMRIALPSLQLASVLPWADRGSVVVTNIASSGTSLLLTWHDGTDGSFAIARGDAWAAPPQPGPHADASAGAYWDRTARAFVIGSRAKQGYNSRTFTFYDESGDVRHTVKVPAPSDLIAHVGLCESAGDVVATTGGSTCRTKSPLTSETSWACVRGTYGTIPDCPGHFSLGKRTKDWLGAAGVMSPPDLPAPLASIFDERGYDQEVILRGDEVMPRQTWIAKDYSSLVRVDGGFVRMRPINAKEAARLGHTPEDETVIERYNELGELAASGAMMRSALLVRVVPAGDQIVLLADTLDACARFDAKTLARLDPPDVVSALRGRLERWGGPSLIFRAAVVFALGLGPLTPFFVLAWLIGRRHPTGALALRLPKILAALAVIAVPTLVATVARYFYL